jgi:hypothetical protein
MGRLEPLTEARVAYFESARRELVGLNYAETIRSPLGLTAAAAQEGLTHAAYFAELLNEWAQEADADERLYRLGASMLDALDAGAPAEPLARYFRVLAAAAAGALPGREGLAVGRGQVVSGGGADGGAARHRHGAGGWQGDTGTWNVCIGAHHDAPGEDVEVRTRAARPPASRVIRDAA